MCDSVRITLRAALAVLGIPAVFAWSALATAQTPDTSSPTGAEFAGLEEITVTAQRREERLVDVPIAVTSVDGDTLQAAGVESTFALTQMVPGMRFDMSGAYVQPTIRGVGSALAGPGMNANVAIYVDGFYLPNLLASDLDLVSVESVDVLKGPQGTLFGRNATGGAILVTTREPSKEFSGEVSLDVGSFERREVGAYLSGLLTSTLSADLALMYGEGDGYIKSVFTGDRVANFEKSTVRGKLKFEPSDTTAITLTLERRRSDDPTANYASNYDGLSFGTIIPGTVIARGPHDYSGAGPSGHVYTGKTALLRAHFDLGFAELTSYSMYRDEEGNEAKDYDGTAVPVFDAVWQALDETYSQEFNLSSKPGGRVSWVAGLFYYHNQNEYPFFNQSFGGAPAFNGFNSDIKQTSMAAFADATWEIVDNLFLTAGVRASQDESDGRYIDFVNAANTRAAKEEWSSVTPRLVLRYQLADSSNVYASFTQGYKAGLVPIQETTTPVDPEKINAFEVGYKHASPTLTFDASAFYYDYKDLQIAAYIGTISLTRNAAESTIYGLDAQLSAQLNDRFAVRAGATYTNAEYDRFPGAVDYQQLLDPTSPFYGIFINPAVDATGNQMQRTPEFTGTLGLQYRQPVSWGEIGFDANLYATSEFFFDPVNRFSQDAYELLNLRATWTAPSGNVSVSLYGNNVTDTEYRAEVLPGPFAIQQVYGEPAAAGIAASVKF